MGRWQPDARGRLERAAMELFAERGYARTTVGEITARAGLTERTFFRYFSDKREVLFSGSAELETTIVERIAREPAETAPLEVVVRAFEAAGAALQARRSAGHMRARHALVVEHAELRERELIKLAALAAAVTRALRARGVAEPAASLVAEAGLAVFKIGFERWVGGAKAALLVTHIRAAARALQAIAAATPGEPSEARPRESPSRGRS